MLDFLKRLTLFETQGVRNGALAAALSAILFAGLPLHSAFSDSAADIEGDLFGPNWPAGPGREETGYLCNACPSLAGSRTE